MISGQLRASTAATAHRSQQSSSPSTMRASLRVLCAFAPLREIGFLVWAAVLAKAQRRKGREGRRNFKKRSESERAIEGIYDYRQICK
jgi:hypothetical protein